MINSGDFLFAIDKNLLPNYRRGKASKNSKAMAKKLLRFTAYIFLALVLIIVGVYISLAVSEGSRATDAAFFNETNSQFLVFAHRGGANLAPENTLEAFRHAARLGADVLELDVRATSDGKLVVMHDAGLERTTEGNGKVGDITLAELKKLDAGFRFSPDNLQNFPFRGKGVTIPTLEEVFDAFPDKRFNIEPKQSSPSIIKPLCQILRERNLTQRVIVGSFSQTVLDEFRPECPEVATSASPSEVSKFLAMYKTGLSDNYRPAMQALQLPANVGGLEIVTKEFVEAAHRKNLKVHVWTINETEQMRRLIEMGVDGIMTDYPDRLLALLGRK